MLKLENGLVILQPAAIVAVGPHGEGQTAIYYAGGTIVCASAPDEVLAAFHGKESESDQADDQADDQAPSAGSAEAV